MCTSYYMEQSEELSRFAIDAKNHRALPKMLEKLGIPLVTDGEICPSNLVPAIAPDCRGKSRTFPMVWGFTGKASLITCIRTEALETSDFLKGIYSRHRCIIPASWYFEQEHLLPTISYDLTGDQTKDNRQGTITKKETKGSRQPSGSRKPEPKPESDLPLGKPYLIQTKNSAVTYIAGMYQFEEIRGVKIPHFVILTRESPQDLRFIHTRMPLILDASDSNMINGWIDPNSGSFILDRILKNAVTDMVYEQRSA